MSLRKDIRRHRRELLDGKVRMSWQTQAGTCFAVGRCLDISVSGMRVECPDPIVLRTFVMFEMVGRGFRGSASVRHCTRTVVRYTLGLEFERGLQWNFRQESSSGDL